MKKWVKRVFFLAVGTLVVMQAVRPARTNPSSDARKDIQAVLAVTPETSALFSRACNDCHSNSTIWPWYSNVAPISWLLVRDVKEGRSELNFSQWGGYDRQKQAKLLEKICEEVKEGDMPPVTYTLAHSQARLSDAGRTSLCSWTRSAGTGLPANTGEGEDEHAKE
jgi:hypothetical protein